MYVLSMCTSLFRNDLGCVLLLISSDCYESGYMFEFFSYSLTTSLYVCYTSYAVLLPPQHLILPFLHFTFPPPSCLSPCCFLLVVFVLLVLLVLSLLCYYMFFLVLLSFFPVVAHLSLFLTEISFHPVVLLH